MCGHAGTFPVGRSCFLIALSTTVLIGCCPALYCPVLHRAAEMAYMFLERNSGTSTIDYPMAGSGAIVDALIRGGWVGGWPGWMACMVAEKVHQHSCDSCGVVGT